MYRVTFAAGIVSAAVIGAYGLRRAGLSLRDCLRVQVTLTAAGVLGAKLFSLYERGGNVWSFASEITQGYRYPGGIIAVAIVLALFGRRLGHGMWMPAMADALASSVGVGMAIVRLGCLAHGCCFGALSGLPWAIQFPAQSPAWHAHVAAGWVGANVPASLPVHPLQLYFVALALAAAGLAVVLQSRKAYDGQVALVFLAVDHLGSSAWNTCASMRCRGSRWHL